MHIQIGREMDRDVVSASQIFGVLVNMLALLNDFAICTLAMLGSGSECALKSDTA